LHDIGKEMFYQPKLMIVGQINISDIKGAKAEATTKVISLIREKKKGQMQ
jgi:hypothetical protein